MLLGSKSHGRKESLRANQFSVRKFKRLRRQHKRRETVKYLASEIFDLDKLFTHRTLSPALDTTNIPQGQDQRDQYHGGEPTG
jgi:hypothetical protein